MNYGIKLKIYLGQEFDSEPVRNDKYIKAEINSYNTIFYGKKHH